LNTAAIENSTKNFFAGILAGISPKSPKKTILYHDLKSDFMGPLLGTISQVTEKRQGPLQGGP
jgi:hypothetical protein